MLIWCNDSMRIESCRKCGKDMIESKQNEHKCVVCGRANTLFCEKCNEYGQEQFHEHVLENYTRKQLFEMSKSDTHVAAMAN